MKALLCAATALGVMGAVVFAGSAQAYPVTVVTAATNGTQFNANPGALSGFSNQVSATFNYVGPLNFANNAAQNTTAGGDLNSTFFGANAAGISNFVNTGSQPTLVIASQTPSTVANFTNQTTFLASSGSVAGYIYGSLYSFNLGTLGAGTSLTITHDDGVTVYRDGILIGSTTSGPTTVTTDKVVLNAQGQTIIYYARENGTPSVFQVTVPEPMSLALVGAGLVGVGFGRRRQSRRAA